jgi:choline dehydrogenase-like flavoprotein
MDSNEMASATLPSLLQLRALADCVIPPSPGEPGGAEGGATAYLLHQLSADGDLTDFAPAYRAFFDALGADFTELPLSTQTERLRALETDETHRAFFRRMVEHIQEGFYSSPAGIELIGWNITDEAQAHSVEGQAAGRLPRNHLSSVVPSTPSGYDVIIVGAGAGGGVIAGVLAEAGKHVLLLERGANRSFGEIGRDHLRNQRLSQYGTNAGPDNGNPRVYQDSRGKAHVIRPFDGGYHNNAAIVGGGTRVYGAQAWRFHPLDFRMASTYGVPAGSSLADWPISFEELVPFYERAERELGVAGDAALMRHLPPYAHDYPMPPTKLNAQGRTARAGAASLGWHTLPPPLAINTVPYQGRPACIHCQHCVGFACPTDAKNGTHNTLIPRALLTGRCDLVTGVMVERIVTENGKAVGVAYFDTEDTRHTVRAEVIVIAGGAIETARLLLNSGLGNDHVGRNLQGHFYPGAFGLLPFDIWDGIGPGVTTATADFNHHNEAEDGVIIGGGMLADDFIPLPATFWKGYTPPNLPRWGEAAKIWMRDNHHRTLKLMGPVQDIPSPEARVQIASEVRDRYGIPVAKLSGTTHPETVRTSEYMWKRAMEWVRACGATEIWGGPPGLGLSAGQHQAGTCRMSDDPATGATDRFCRLHGHDNLYIGDGSVHVTNGGFNPFLTIMALAYRTAEHIREHW